MTQTPIDFKCICDPDYPFEPPNPTPVAVEGCPAHRVRRTAQQFVIQALLEDEARERHEANPLPAPLLCEVDGKPIVTMTFKQTGVCSELCRKERDGEISRFAARG